MVKMGDVAREQYFSLSSSVYFLMIMVNPIVAGDYMEQQDFYTDLSVYCDLGEGTYPEVRDKKRIIKERFYFTGADSGFANIPSGS